VGAFTTEFITMVKARFPVNADGLHEALLDEDPSKAIHLMMQRTNECLPVEHIIALIESGRAEDLLDEARSQVAGLKLIKEAYDQVHHLSHPWNQLGKDT
jgi:hypothetical protein